MNVACRLLLALMIALTSLSAMSLKHDDQSADDEEIRIGNFMPYTGPLAGFAAIGKAEAAYFDMINERGGINGRKVRFISYDDNSDPTVALDLTRGLIERENVLLMFGSFGTPENLAVRGFLNERKIPQLFVASGDDLRCTRRLEQGPERLLRPAHFTRDDGPAEDERADHFRENKAPAH